MVPNALFAEELVAVVIPFYNREKYICRCLDSVIRQSHDNLIICCVDDGSTDESVKVLQRYASIDKRIRLIVQSNKGVSGARNAAILYLQTLSIQPKWVTFLDSDDYFTDTFIEEMLSFSSNSCEVLVGSFIHIDGQILRESSSTHNYSVLPCHEALKSLIIGATFPGVCGKLILWDRIRALFFDERLRISEDFDYLFHVYLRISRIALCPVVGYCYQTGNDHVSLTKGVFSIASMISEVLALINCLETLQNSPKSQLPLLEYQQMLLDYFCAKVLGLFGRVKLPLLLPEEKENYSFALKYVNDHKIIKKANPKKKETKILRLLYLYCRPLFRLLFLVRR